MRRSGAAAWSGAAAAVAALLWSPPAKATNFEVQADSVGQSYDVSSPWGNITLERRRYLQMLSLGVYNLQGKPTKDGPELNLVLKMRVDADFGVNGHLSGAESGGETRPDVANGARYVPGLQIAPIDLMWGYFEAKHLAKGWLGFRLGRQYQSDALGWWSFDGGLVRVTTPYFVQVEAYGGLEQRGGLPLSTSRWERQGVWRGSRDGYGAQSSTVDYPSFQPASLAPAFGVNVETSGVSWIHGRLSYRRVYNLGDSITEQFPTNVPGPTPGGYPTVSGLRISQDRIGYALWVDKADLGGIKAGLTYDLYLEQVGTFNAGFEARAGKHVTVGADFDYYLPTFDADSIWNWFTRSPILTGTARVEARVDKKFDASASGGVRAWMVDGDPKTFGEGQCERAGAPKDCFGQVTIDPTAGPGGFSRDPDNRGKTATLDALGNLAARFKFRSAELNGRGSVQIGDRGRRVGGDVQGETAFVGGRFSVGAILSLYDWVDNTRPDRSATSFGYVLAAAFHPFLDKKQPGRPDFRVEWQHDYNRLVEHRFRLVGMFSIWAGK